MRRSAIILAIIMALSLSLATLPAAAADWKLTDASSAEYRKLATPEKEIAEKWLATLPAASYKESFTQLVMGLVVWVNRDPISFLDYEFVKLFKTTGEKVDIYTFKAGQAKMATDIYSPPIIPGDLWACNFYDWWVANLSYPGAKALKFWFIADLEAEAARREKLVKK